jgi:3D-(3,5/4)-trihydroxycyclohexane-1,2-dione acylhydrolase (decyclizing)
MGAETETVTSTSELEGAFLRAKKSKKTYVIALKTHGYEWLEGTAFWESPTLEVYSTEENKKAYEEHSMGKAKQRRGV